MAPLAVATITRARKMTARTIILFTFLLLCATHYIANQNIARGINSYPCVQAETNRAPNPGCQSSRKELPSDS